MKIDSLPEMYWEERRELKDSSPEMHCEEGILPDMHCEEGILPEMHCEEGILPEMH